jgi:hypothetical protein
MNSYRPHLRATKGLVGHVIADEEERTRRAILRRQRRTHAEENVSNAENDKADRVLFGYNALQRLADTALIAQAKQRVEYRRNPPEVCYVEGRAPRTGS